MSLTQQKRVAFTAWYCILFYMLMLYKWINGSWLVQLKPHLYNTRFDLATWLLMKTKIHVWLLDNPAGWIFFDLAFYSMPLAYWLAFKKNKQAAMIVAVIMFFVNFIYIECYTLYPANSIESFTQWLLFPLLFMTATLNGFYYLLNGLRYFFLFLIASAAIWKVIQSGLFNSGEMSGVLLFQHKEYLVSSPQSWYTDFIYWLINHPATSYLLYVVAALLEISFLAGFFTKKYDRFLAGLFFLFLVMDILIMRIPYWEISPFVLTLIYGKYGVPANTDVAKR